MPGKHLRRYQLGIQQLEDRRLLAVSGLEQEFIYNLNRARDAPATYAQEQNLTVSLQGIPSSGPLAVNTALGNSTDTKTADLVANNYFDHVSPAGVNANQLVINSGYPLPTSYPSNSNTVESLSAGNASATATLNQLLTDAGVPGALHRVQLLGTDAFFGTHREIGVGYLNNASATFRDYWAIHTATRNEPTNFLTGVVYDDINNNRRYESGEGLAGVSITVNGTSTVSTNAAGGWSIAVDAGQHTVVASGGSFQGFATASPTVADQNVAVDFISNQVTSDLGFVETYATNASNRFDVNGVGGVTALDALQIVNFLGRRTGGNFGSLIPVFLDVNGQNDVTAVDALQVINELARLGATTEQPISVPISLLRSDTGSLANETFPLDTTPIDTAPIDTAPIDTSIGISQKVDWSVHTNAQHQQVLITTAQHTAFVSSIADDYETLCRLVAQWDSPEFLSPIC